MTRVTHKHARSKPHRLFEDSRYVPPQKTATLLDESMWKKADTLNDDDHDFTADASNPLGRNAPEVDDNSDLNPNPASEERQQDMQQGEQTRSVVENAGGGIEDDYQSYPEIGDRYYGRPELLHNFPSDKNKLPTETSGSGKVNAQQATQPGVIENPGETDLGIKKLHNPHQEKRQDQPPPVAPVVPPAPTTALHTAQLGQTVKDLGRQLVDPVRQYVPNISKSGIGLDQFVSSIGSSDQLTQEQFGQLNKVLVRELMNAGVLQQPTYRVNRQILDSVLKQFQSTNRDLSAVTSEELQQALSGVRQQQTQQMNQGSPAGSGGGQGGGFGGTSPLAQPPQQEQPSADQPTDQPEPQKPSFDLSKIPNVSGKKLAQISNSVRQLPPRSEKLLTHLTTTNKELTVGQFLEMPFENMPQPVPAKGEADQLERKRPYVEPMTGQPPTTAQVHIPSEDAEADLAGPDVPLSEPQEEPQFTEEELTAAKKPVYESALKIEAEIVKEQQEREQQTQPLHSEQPEAAAPVAQPAQDNAAQIQSVINALKSQGVQNIPDSFQSLEELNQWMQQQGYAQRNAIRALIKKAMGIDMPKIMKIEDVRRVSPKHAAKMEQHGIEWVEEDSFMDHLRKETARLVAASEDPVKMVHLLRREGRSFNFINGEIISGFLSGHYDANKRDAGHVALHRLAQRTIEGTFNITAEDLRRDADGYIELMAAKSEVTPRNYVKKAAKQIRAKDYTLYNLKADADASDFNYADPWDVEWTLYRQTEGGKKGAKLDTMKSPSCAIMCCADHGDGKYLVSGLSMLDEAYWGTYTIKVQKGIVTQYAKIPVDKDGKRLASVGSNEEKKRIMSRRKYVALYKALVKTGQITAQMNEPAPGWEDHPQSDEEIDQRMQQVQEWQGRRQKQDQEISDRINKMVPQVSDVDFTTDFPSQEEVDEVYYNALKEMLSGSEENSGQPIR